MSCKVQAVAPLTGDDPRISFSNLGPSLQFKKKTATRDSQSFEALYESASYTASGNTLLALGCSFAKLQESCTIVEMDNQQLQYFCINDVQPNYSAKSDVAVLDFKSIGVFWVSHRNGAHIYFQGSFTFQDGH